MKSNRRTFIKKASTGAIGIAAFGAIPSISAKSYSKILGANDRIHVGIQGLGRRWGGFIEPITQKDSNVELVYLCDVMQSQREKAAQTFAKKASYKPHLVNDFRKVLDDKKVDAVFIATPDHWHTPGACMAMEAGKHVYVEKPCSHNPHENEIIVDFQKKYNKVVQMGNQQRSSIETNHIIREIHNGIIGQTYKAIAFYINSRGEVPVPKKASIPDGLDWDLFQGPSPRKEYQYNTWDYNWHWYGWDFGTAEMGNNATHELDIARWALDVNYPVYTDVLAGKYQFVEDGWSMYDTMEANFKFSNGKLIQWDGSSRNGYNKYGKGRGTIVYGDKGSVFLDRSGYTLYDRKGKVIEDSQSTSKESGLALGGGGNLTTRHGINFFQTIRGKSKLTSSIEVGAVSQMLTHYANIAYRVSKPLQIDDKTGEIKDQEAMALWKRTYEPGWEPKL